MPSNERRLVVEPLVPPLPPPKRPRWHSRWGLVIALQAGMIVAFALRHADREAPEVVRSETAIAVPPPRLAPPTTVIREASVVPAPVASSRPARTATSRPRAAPPAPDRLVEVDLVSEPPGATVRIGDQVGGITPLAAFLPARTTTIRFELDGYVPYATRWSPRSSRRIAAVLKPAL